MKALRSVIVLAALIGAAGAQAQVKIKANPEVEVIPE